MPIRNVYLDCEFLPAYLHLPGLVSIGLCDDQGSEYYAINRDCDWETLIESEWMCANVLPSLPLRLWDAQRAPAFWDFDSHHPDYAAVKAPAKIRDEIAEWFAAWGGTTHLYARYGGRDICRLHSLWNSDWSVMPDAVPRWFHELETLRWQAGGPDMPKQADGEHNALADARHNRAMHEFLRNLAA